MSENRKTVGEYGTEPKYVQERIYASNRSPRRYAVDNPRVHCRLSIAFCDSRSSVIYVRTFSGCKRSSSETVK